MSGEPDPAGDFIDACIQDLDEARRLFAADPQVVYLTKIGSPILHWMVIEDFQIGVQRLLEVFEVDVDHRDKHGETALHHASGLGRLGSARMLVHHGADANAIDESLSENCLHKAVRAERFDVVLLLLRAGAKPEYKLDEITTIGHAMSSWLPPNRQELLGCLEQLGWKIEDLMREHGLDELFDSPAEAYGWEHEDGDDPDFAFPELDD